MAPFAADAVGALDQLAVDHQPAAAPGADDDGEGHLGPGHRAVDSLGQGQAIGAVGKRWH